MRELKPRNEFERVEGDWIVCVRCGVKMRNHIGTTAHLHPRDCYLPENGGSQKALDEYDRMFGHNTGTAT